MAILGKKVQQYRVKRMQDAMRELKCDGIALTSADWFEWASNLPVRDLAWERPFLLVINSDGESCALMAEQSRNHVRKARDRGAIWIDHIEFYSESPHRPDGARPATEWTQAAADLLKDHNLDATRLVVDADSPPLSAAGQLLPRLSLHGANGRLRPLRWVKHEDEIAIMRDAASLSDWALNAYRRELRPGRLLAEVDYTVSAQLSGEAARRFPGEDFSISSLSTLSGATSACPKGDGAPNGRLLENNAIATTTLATRLNGLAMEVARPWLVGRPPSRVLECVNWVVEAQAAAIEAAIAGQPVSGIHMSALKVAEKRGVSEYMRLRAGHGIGVAMHDYPEDTPFNSRSLLANETYAVEPGLYVDGLGGFRFADVIAVQNGPPKIITNGPRSLEHQLLN